MSIKVSLFSKYKKVIFIIRRKIIIVNMNRGTTLCMLIASISTSISRVQISSKNIVYWNSVPLKESPLWVCQLEFRKITSCPGHLWCDRLYGYPFTMISIDTASCSARNTGRWTMSAIYIGGPFYATYLFDKEFLLIWRRMPLCCLHKILYS